MPNLPTTKKCICKKIEYKQQALVEKSARAIFMTNENLHKLHFCIIVKDMVQLY